VAEASSSSRPWPQRLSSRSRRHIQTPFYRAQSVRQARQAVPRVPADCAPRRCLVQEDQGQITLLRSVGRSRCRPGEVPRTER
jgi:hypothetical protein